MHKRTLITLSGLVLVSLLVYRLFHRHVDGVKAERVQYVQDLNCEFSAIVDTVENEGNILIVYEPGSVDTEMEFRLNQKLKYNGMLDLFLYRPGNRILLMIDSAAFYRRRDSLYINCQQNIIRTYRNNRLRSEKPLLNSIRGRPF
jgi:hypothetical protein